jgi:hypothetical protein
VRRVSGLLLALFALVAWEGAEASPSLPLVAPQCQTAAGGFAPCDSGSAFASVTPMTVGTAYAAGRSIQIICTAAGNVSLQVGGAADVVPMAGATGGTLTILHYAVTAVNSSGTTATCTYANLN